MFNKFLPVGLVATITGLSACHSIENRYDTRDQLLSHHSTAQTFVFRSDLPLSVSQIRTSSQATMATLYIEGDGFAYLSKSRPSGDPTPKTPVALGLAVQDPSPNVYYLARPCQYIKEPNACHPKYWTTHRYGQKVLVSFEDVLDTIKQENGHIEAFHLIGFSGGANIAGLLAAKRDDIATIRTVAGNLDNDFFTNFHDVSAMPYSLNMADYSEILTSIPQIHFISDNDKFVPPIIAQSYLNKLQNQFCVQTITVKDTMHLSGWTEQWQHLLKIEPDCQ